MVDSGSTDQTMVDISIAHLGERKRVITSSNLVLEAQRFLGEGIASSRGSQIANRRSAQQPIRNCESISY